MSPPKVLIVVAEEADLNAGVQLLEKEAIEITGMTSPREALQKISRTIYAVVIADQKMPELDGASFLGKVKDVSPETVCLIRTDQSELTSALNAINRGLADRSLDNPWNRGKLVSSVRDAVAHHEGSIRRRQMEIVQIEGRERFQNLIETVSEWIWEINPKGIFTFCNSRVTDILGYGLDELLDKTPFDLMSADEAQRVRAIFEKIAVRKEPIVSLENTFIHKNGHPVVFETDGLPFFGPKGELLGYRGSCRDITEAKRAKEYLRTSELRLVEENERRRIANLLHDRICQYLVGASMRLAALEESKSPRNNRVMLNEVSKLIENATRDIRLLISQLDPHSVAKVDFKTAVQRLAREMQMLFHLKIGVRYSKEATPMNDELKTLLFQSIRELLINVAKHAGTHEAQVEIRCVDHEVHAIVRDRGMGFDPRTTKPAGDEAGGYGLNSISDRLKFFGGSLSIKSGPRRGTVATVVVPLKSKN
jgi:PAS domain S-box-containing protein